MPHLNIGEGHEPIDPEERKRFHSLEARAVTMPDGQERIISIEHWFWYCLDYMADDWETDIDFVLESVTRGFGQDDDFEEELPNHVRLWVSAFISHIIGNEDGLANESWYRVTQAP